MLLRNSRLSGISSAVPAPIAPETEAADITSQFGFAIDITNGWVLYNKRGYEVYTWPASTVKIMTVLLIAELKGDSLTETVTWQTSDDLASGFSQADLQNGDVITWQDIIHAALMISAGDACQAAARVLGNEDLDEALTSSAGYARFTEMMTERAAALGCKTVRYSNAHGADPNYMSARDLAFVAAACFSNPVVDSMAREINYAISVAGPNARTINIENTNPTLAISGVRGVKTGSLTWGGASDPPDTYSMATLWRAPNDSDVAIVNMFASSASDRLADTAAMISNLPDDFPYLAGGGPGPLPDLPLEGNIRYWFLADRDAYTDDAGAVPAANGDPVQMWGNNGGASDDALQPTSGKRPIFRTGGLAGKPYLEFNFNNLHQFENLVEGTQGSGITNWTPYSVFFVADRIRENKIAASSTSSAYIFAGNVNDFRKSNVAIYQNTETVRWGKVAVQRPLPDVTGPNVIGVGKLNDAAGFRFASHEESANNFTVSGNAVSTATSVLSFTRVAPDLGTFDGRLYEVLYYNTILSNAQFDEVIAYLKAKYGIA